MRILFVDDDAGLRSLLRTTFQAVDVELSEAESVATARTVVRVSPPDVVVLDVTLPDGDGVAFCKELRARPETRSAGVVLLTGANGVTKEVGEAAGADAFLAKPFSPLELLAVVERLAGGLHPLPFRAEKAKGIEEQLQLYARDLRHLLEIERGQRVLLENAYRETAAALATALESKDSGTRQHCQRVQRYAVELAREANLDVADDPSAEYGYLLHDIGKIGIPDRILLKPGPLNDEERRQMKTHTILGEQMLGGVTLLQGTGLGIVRSHHERWDGSGYPDRLEGNDIPAGARVFAVADALDAMTSDRPYRPAQQWSWAGREIASQSGRQFDPTVVCAFETAEPVLREIHRELVAV
jgi:response regulator RpfG family c-di-GMP phosphodiesterase